MSNVQTTAGTKWHVLAGAPATYTIAGFEALTLVEVGEITNLGDIGPEFTLVTYDALGNRITKKLKGQVDMGSQSTEVGRDITDAGQAILKAAVTIGSASVDQIHSFGIEYKDGSFDYYTGLPMSYSTSLGDANQVTAAAVAVEIDNEILEAPAP